MAYDHSEFMTKVRAADHGFAHSFTLSKSALKDLIGVLDRHKRAQDGHREIHEAIKHIPAEKKKKYQQALDYLESNYPHLKEPASAAKYADRVFNVGNDLRLLKSPLATTTDCLIFGHAGHVPDDERFAGTFTVPRSTTLRFYTLHGQSNYARPDTDLSSKPRDAIFFSMERLVMLPKKDTANPGGEPKMAPKTHRPEVKVRDAKGNVLRTTRGPEELKLEQLEISQSYKGAAPVRESTPGLRPARTRLDKLSHMLLDTTRQGAAPKGLDRMAFTGGDDCYNYVVKNGLGLHWESDSLNEKPWNADDILEQQDRMLKNRLAIAPGDRQAIELSAAWVPHFVYVKSEGVTRLSDIISDVLIFTGIQLGFRSLIKDFYFAGCRGIEVGWRPDARH